MSHFDLSSKTDFASSYASANVAARVVSLCKPSHPSKVETPWTNSIYVVIVVVKYFIS